MTTIELRKYTPTEPGLYLVLFSNREIPELVRLYSSGNINATMGSVNVPQHMKSGSDFLVDAQWSDPLDVRVTLRIKPENKEERY